MHKTKQKKKVLQIMIREQISFATFERNKKKKHLIHFLSSFNVTTSESLTKLGSTVRTELKPPDVLLFT